MGPVVSALVVLSALAVSAALLVHLVITEGRRWDRRHGIERRGPAAVPRPAAHPRVRPPSVARPVVPSVAQPATGAAGPATAAAWPPTLSSDGAWTWTGSGWVTTRWGAVSAVPPSPAAPPRPARSHGCLWAVGVGCMLLLG